MKLLLLQLAMLPVHSNAALHVAGTAAALTLGVAVLQHIDAGRPSVTSVGARPTAHTSLSIPATLPVGAGAGSRAAFFSDYAGAGEERLSWLELERERLGLSALRRPAPPLVIEETEATRPFLAELEAQRELLEASPVVRVPGE